MLAYSTEGGEGGKNVSSAVPLSGTVHLTREGWVGERRGCVCVHVCVCVCGGEGCDYSHVKTCERDLYPRRLDTHHSQKKVGMDGWIEG